MSAYKAHDERNQYIIVHNLLWTTEKTKNSLGQQYSRIQ